ncbi:methylated-DNA--[protein]-cysteine S-methyltransferase [Frondihabitans sp. PAMC 28766]|uniref:methylated-DNA--[protein]-cysteine S-methyltransferase n=1 Tax=Frondihabitans sp. PAMC 28766 TaxID=1795630 RepID=UPI0012FFB046|nr:methylated-DNA--[protein]-cysteine S-methyltransferase [Frondihabitans sp. PAMC 28766]
MTIPSQHLTPAFPSPFPSDLSAVVDTAIVTHDSPVGLLRIHTRHGSIVRLDIDADDPAAVRPNLPEAPNPLHDEARRQLDDYFAERRHSFDLPLGQIGTVFQAEVWSALTELPFGSATSYGELAELTGRPTGARAVGGAIRANRIALLVPCHRVLGVGRRLTGYTPGRGIETKRWLLEHEGIEFTQPAPRKTFDRVSPLAASEPSAMLALPAMAPVFDAWALEPENAFRDDDEPGFFPFDDHPAAARPVDEVADGGQLRP